MVDPVESRIALFGTDEAPPVPQLLIAGPMSAELDAWQLAPYLFQRC